MGEYAEVSRRKERWERISRTLASTVIQTCATAESMPTSRHVLDAVFPDWDDDFNGKEKVYKSRVTVSRKGLIQSLNLSKKIIQRSKLEHENDEEYDEVNILGDWDEDF